tara:strand:+ start:28655 stop:29572 length:918 start_codon:yes stop_codon:yes gene_type:complete
MKTLIQQAIRIVKTGRIVKTHSLYDKAYFQTDFNPGVHHWISGGIIRIARSFKIENFIERGEIEDLTLTTDSSREEMKDKLIWSDVLDNYFRHRYEDFLLKDLSIEKLKEINRGCLNWYYSVTIQTLISEKKLAEVEKSDKLKEMKDEVIQGAIRAISSLVERGVGFTTEDIVDRIKIKVPGLSFSWRITSMIIDEMAEGGLLPGYKKIGGKFLPHKNLLCNVGYAYPNADRSHQPKETNSIVSKDETVISKEAVDKYLKRKGFCTVKELQSFLKQRGATCSYLKEQFKDRIFTNSKYPSKTVLR